MSDPLLEVEDLTVQYETPRGDLTAVSEASFSLDDEEYLGLVGESGCGKSTIAKAIIGGLDSNSKITSGSIRYRGKSIQDMSEGQLNEEIRWKEISWIPQSAMSSLDPLKRIDEQAVRLAKVHSNLTKGEAKESLEEMFEIVGLSRDRVSDYPHQFSGGMSQRALIAFALFLDPALIIADEPTTALDVIMQDQVFKHLDMIKEQSQTSLILITHDISVVFESCNDIVIMHGGQVAETGSVRDIYNDPRHPYSILLQEAFPNIQQPNRDLEVINGHPPQSYGSIERCSFSDRCPWAIEECHKIVPELEPVGNGTDQRASCHRKDEVQELYEEPEER